KMRDLESTVRSLRGENEELAHRVTELSTKIERVQKDFEYRLCQMSAQQLGAGAGQGDPNAVPCPGGAGGSYAPSGGANPPGGTYAPSGAYSPSASSSGDDSYAPSGGASDNGDDSGPPPSGRTLARGPGVLGTLPGDSADAPPRPSRNTAPAAASGGDAHGQYSDAMNLLAKARYDEARAAFRAFADAHPDDPLAPQAVYWIGDIAYVQKDYPTA